MSEAAATYGARIMARCAALRQISETPEAYCRRYLTPEHRAALDLLGVWMHDAGLAVREDAAGNLIGRREGLDPDAPVLIVGSHQDTVRDAGAYDGMLGVLAGIEVAQALHDADRSTRHALEIYAFGDEEGARFAAAYLGSRALAGTRRPEDLALRDDDGVTLAEAMRAFGLDPLRLSAATRDPATVVGYLEAHIEQGPVLDALDLPVGVVTAINGQSRLAVQVTGMAGHAGTVPMELRQDALTGAVAMIRSIEDIARAGDHLVATVGRIEALPGAINVIPGTVRFSVDVRAPADAARLQALATIRESVQRIADERRLQVQIELTHDHAAISLDATLGDALARACAQITGWPARRLASGAGHDAAAMSALCPCAMLFVRCEGGISHHPNESITADDADIAVRVLLATLLDLDDRR